MAAIPAILALWMLKPRRPRLRVPSLMLWPASPAERQSTRPWQRLRNHPLLWLQIAIAALLALAAAQPFVPADAAGRHLLVLLDASGSMRAEDVAPDRFAAAKAAVLEMARGLGPDQEMTVLRLDEQPRVLVAGARNAGQVETAIAGETASFGPPDVAAALALASGLTQGPAEWVLIGDGGITIPESARRPAGTGYRFVQVGAQPGNVAVTALALRQGDGDVTIQAGIKNSGNVALSGRLQLLAEGNLAGSQEWQLEAEAESYLTWSHLPAGPKWYEARLSGVPAAANGLESDDRAWAVPAGATETQLLLVTSGNSFLERVLSVQGNLRSFKAGPADWAGLASKPGESYPLTVLDRLWPETLPAGSALLVGPPSGEEFQPQQMWPKADHPLLRNVDWSEVRVARARQLHLDGSWETEIDSDGGPLLAVRTEGGRRQAVLAFELGQSDLPLRPAFPVLMANLLDWLLPRPGDAPRSVAPGSSVVLDPAPLTQQMWVEGPGGAHFDLAPPWPPRPFLPPAPGLYRAVQGGDSGRQESFLIAGGYDPQESDLAPRSVDVPAADGAVSLSARGAVAFWPWLAGALLLISMVEWWVDARGR
jgi:Ca-activated chloride channel homolog